MKKKILIIILSLLQVYLTFSQNDFYFKRINTISDESLFDIAIIPNSTSFFMPVYYKDVNINNRAPKLYKYSNNQISDSLVLTSDNGDIVEIKYINNNLYAFGFTTNDSTNKIDLSFWILDTSLNVILNTKYPCDFFSRYYLFSTATSNNDFVISFTGRDSTNNSGILYLIIDSLGNAKAPIKYLNYQNMDFGYNIIQMNNNYYSFVFSDKYGQQYGFPGCIIKLDSLLNVNEVHPMQNNALYNMTTLIPKNNNEFYICGKNIVLHHIGGNDYRIETLLMDTLYNIKDSLYIGSNSTDTFDFPSMFKSIDYINYTDIFVSGIYNFDIDNYWGTMPSWVEIYNLDSLLNIRWRKYIGGDAYYFVSGIKATSDKGCFVYGNFYNYNDSILQHDIFIIKIDSLGNVVTSIPNNIQIFDNAIIYPNPGHDELMINIPGNYSETIFELYNVTGVLYLQEKFKTTQLNVNTTQLTQGIYFYRIIKNNKTISTGKWIKQ